MDGILHCRVCLAAKGPGGARVAWRSLTALLPALALAPLAWLGVSGALYALNCAVATLPWLREQLEKLAS